MEAEKFIFKFLPPIKQGKLSAIIFKVMLRLAKNEVCLFAVLFLFEFPALEVPIPSSLFEIQQSGNFKTVFFSLHTLS